MNLVKLMNMAYPPATETGKKHYRNGNRTGYHLHSGCVKNGALTLTLSPPPIPALTITRTAPLYRVLSIHALKEAGFTSKDDLQIASGIPLNHFYKGSDLNPENIDAKLQIFNETVTIHGGGDVPTPSICQVYPEALAGLGGYLY